MIHCWFQYTQGRSQELQLEVHISEARSPPPPPNTHTHTGQSFSLGWVNSESVKIKLTYVIYTDSLFIRSLIVEACKKLYLA